MSLGSYEEDQNSIVCWNVIEGRSECNSQATDQLKQECTAIQFYSRDPNKFVTAHADAVKIWHVNEKQGKMTRYDVQLGRVHRTVQCIAIDAQD